MKSSLSEADFSGTHTQWRDKNAAFSGCLGAGLGWVIVCLTAGLAFVVVFSSSPFVGFWLCTRKAINHDKSFFLFFRTPFFFFLASPIFRWKSAIVVVVL